MSDERLDYLSADDILEIAASVLPTLDVRDIGLLESAAGRPRTSAFGRDAYPSFAEKVAALIHSLARNHPLVDGNKRLAWSAGRVVCLLNCRDLDLSVDDAEALIVGAATGELDVPALAERISSVVRAD